MKLTKIKEDFRREELIPERFVPLLQGQAREF
jgi:hypothetical protein